MTEEQKPYTRSPKAETPKGLRWFDLTACLKPPRTALDPIPLLDLLAIALLFSLLFSRLVITPGVRLELPETSMRIPQSAAKVAVLTVQNEGMLLFDGGVYQVETIEPALKERVAANTEGSIVLLLKAGERLPMASLMEISAKAQNAGFAQIHLAAKRRESSTEALSPVPSNPDNNYNFPTPNQ